MPVSGSGLCEFIFPQVEGGFMQGVGLFTLEHLDYSPEGSLLTRGPGSYKIPAFGDIPTQLSVALLRDAPNDKAVYSSKVRPGLELEGFLPGPIFNRKASILILSQFYPHLT